jgi:hypothetical protein
MSGRLMSLDLATNVGHARLLRQSPPMPPRFGTLKLKGDVATKLAQFGNWLDDVYMVDPFDALAWERPLLAPTDTVDLLELLYGLVGICYAFVGKRSHPMPWREVDVQTAKIALTGDHRADKDDMERAARNVMGWRVANHHQADAGAVGLVAYEQIWPRARAAA